MFNTLFNWIFGFLAIAVGDGYAAHLCLGDGLSAEDCALALEVERLKR